MNDEEELIKTKLWTRVLERWQTLIEDGHISTIFWAVFWIAVVGTGGYYFYHSHQEEIIKQQKEQAKKEQVDKEWQITEKENNKYKNEMNQVCNNKLAETTGVDFFRCKNIKDDSNIYGDMRTFLQSPNLPSFCQRKTKEMTTNEFIECLEEPQETE